MRDRFTVQGFEVPAGLSVGASILEIHRDPALYPEPSRFLPERFLERRFPPYEFAAFGGGHRHCIAAAFAMSEIKMVLGALIPRADLALEIERPLRIIRRNVALAPEAGVPLRVVRQLEGRSARAA